MIFLSLSIFLTVFLLVGCIHPSNAEPRTISVEVTVPDPAWKVTIREIYVKDDRLLVVSELERDPDVMAAQVISQTSDSVRVSAPDLPVDHYVLGRTFNWSREPHRFIDDRSELTQILQSADRIYQRPKDEGSLE